MKTIMQIKDSKKRVELRTMLLKHKENSKEQMELLTAPLKERVKLIDQVLKNELPLEVYVNRSKQISEWYETLLGGKK